MTLYSYPITIEREGKQYYAYSEDFPGVYGLGKTIEEAKQSILKAMTLYITKNCFKRRQPSWNSLSGVIKLATRKPSCAKLKKWPG